MRNACQNQIFELAKKNSKVLFIGSDLGAGVQDLLISVQCGENTWWIISATVEKKNEILSESCDLSLPSDLWKLIVSYF